MTKKLEIYNWGWRACLRNGVQTRTVVIFCPTRKIVWVQQDWLIGPMIEAMASNGKLLSYSLSNSPKIEEIESALNKMEDGINDVCDGYDETMDGRGFLDRKADDAWRRICVRLDQMADG